MWHTLVDTSIGYLGFAWGADGNANGQIWAVQLPEASPERTTARLLRGAPAAMNSGEGARVPVPMDLHDRRIPVEVGKAIAGVQALLRGQRDALTWIALDMARVPSFHRQVYELARQIPPGQTRTYGDLARELGEPGAARAVGQALGSNPFAPVVPCHRILAASGLPGGFSATGGIRTKLRLLEIERACFGGQAGLF